MRTRTEAVREIFENTDQYLKFDYNLRIRKETVETFTKDLHFNSVIDMPCGNGEISKPLIAKAKEITLMDISENMIRLAEQNVSGSSSTKIFLVNEDFFNYDFKNKDFDLVICLGLIAHVESPDKLMNKLSGLVKKGGLLIFQNTDAGHFYTNLIRTYLGLKNIVKRSSYRLNSIKGEYVENYFKSKGFMLEKQFRYNQSFLGFSNLFSNEKKYKITRKYFGDAESPKHQAKGSDVTYLFRKNSN